jgi:hypothetical protein
VGENIDLGKREVDPGSSGGEYEEGTSGATSGYGSDATARRSRDLDNRLKLIWPVHLTPKGRLQRQ